MPNAVARMEAELGHFDVIAELVAFLRQAGRGISNARDRLGEAA